MTELQKECDSSGRSFAEAAVARKLLAPEEIVALLRVEAPELPRPARTAPAFQWLLVATLAVLGVLVILGVLIAVRRSERDTRLAEESIVERARAERRARDAAIDYQRSRLASREADARAALEKARATMKFAEERIREAPGEPQLHPHLVEATIGFNTWIQEHPDDAAALLERSRAYELRRDFERALADIDRAVELRKDLAPQVDAKLQELRLQVARAQRFSQLDGPGCVFENLHRLQPGDVVEEPSATRKH